MIGFDDLLLLSVAEPRERAGYHSNVHVKNKKGQYLAIATLQFISLSFFMLILKTNFRHHFGPSVELLLT